MLTPDFLTTDQLRESLHANCAPHTSPPLSLKYFPLKSSGSLGFLTPNLLDSLLSALQ